MNNPLEPRGLTPPRRAITTAPGLATADATAYTAAYPLFHKAAAAAQQRWLHDGMRLIYDADRAAEHVLLFGIEPTGKA